MKHRINLSQEFVIGGYVPSHLGVDSIVIGAAETSDCTMRRVCVPDSFP
jgi:hypothetical protein